jgi:hypothetical protein
MALRDLKICYQDAYVVNVTKIHLIIEKDDMSVLIDIFAGIGCFFVSARIIKFWSVKLEDSGFTDKNILCGMISFSVLLIGAAFILAGIAFILVPIVD